MNTLANMLRTFAGALETTDPREALLSDLRCFIFNTLENAFSYPKMYAQSSAELETMLWAYLAVLEWVKDDVNGELTSRFRVLLAEELKESASVASTRGMLLDEAARHLRIVWRQIWENEL